MKVYDVMWFSTMKGMMGIVLAEDEDTKQRKAYIGLATALNAPTDVQYILDWGAKLLPEQVEQMMKFFKVEKDVVQMKKWKSKSNKCPICGSMVRFGKETVKCSNDKCPGEWKLDHAQVNDCGP